MLYSFIEDYLDSFKWFFYRYYKVRITIESDEKEDTETAKKMFCERVPSNVIVDYDKFV